MPMIFKESTAILVSVMIFLTVKHLSRSHPAQWNIMNFFRPESQAHCWQAWSSGGKCLLYWRMTEILVHCWSCQRVIVSVTRNFKLSNLKKGGLSFTDDLYFKVLHSFQVRPTTALGRRCVYVSDKSRTSFTVTSQNNMPVIKKWSDDSEVLLRVAPLSLIEYFRHIFFCQN